MKSKNRIIVILFIAACVERCYEIKTMTSVASITVDEMTPLSLELVYQGTKPEEVSSVQSMAITDSHFVIAGRPYGSAEQGGETNNKLVIVDREHLADVTVNYLSYDQAFELGHANGMTYNPYTNRLMVVGIRNSEGNCDGACAIDADTFQVTWSGRLPTIGNGIAYDDKGEGYYLRDGNGYSYIDEQLSEVQKSGRAVTDLTNQDIGYYNGKLYLVNWADELGDAFAVGVLTDQNVIYQYDPSNDTMRAFAVLNPRMEMESIDFADGVAYVLFNGGGSKQQYFYIYRVDFAQEDLE